ncbi:Transcriptional regulatory protein [Borealophlyctis nickersoniae]|nr:Transcriptional regulatory protein [Borealophlyctis nickersoniae]
MDTEAKMIPADEEHESGPDQDDSSPDKTGRNSDDEMDVEEAGEEHEDEEEEEEDESGRRDSRSQSRHPQGMLTLEISTLKRRVEFSLSGHERDPAEKQLQETGDDPQSPDSSPSTSSPTRHSPSPVPSDSEEPDIHPAKRMKSKHEKDKEKDELASVEDDEHERSRREALQIIMQIERDFAAFRDKMYHEKLAEIEREEAAIRNGTHPALVAQLAEIERKKDERLQSAAARKRQQEMGFEAQFQSAVLQARYDFISRRGNLRQKMMNSIQEKRWRMLGEKRQLDSPPLSMPPMPVPDRATLAKRRKAHKTEMAEWRAVIAAGGFPAATIHGLSKPEINEDLEAMGIARAHGASNRSRKAAPPPIKDPAVPNLATSAAPAALSSSAVPSTVGGPLNQAGNLGHQSHDHFPPHLHLYPASGSGGTHYAQSLFLPSGAQSTPNHPPSQSQPVNFAGFVQVEGDQLRYGTHVFRQNDKAYMVDNGIKCAVKIAGFGDDEVVVQRTDGSKTRVSLGVLADGRVSLLAKG